MVVFAKISAINSNNQEKSYYNSIYGNLNAKSHALEIKIASKYDIGGVK